MNFLYKFLVWKHESNYPARSTGSLPVPRPRAGFVSRPTPWRCVPNFRPGWESRTTPSQTSCQALRGGSSVVFGQSCQVYFTRYHRHVLCVRKHICTVRVDAIMQVANLLPPGRTEEFFIKTKCWGAHAFLNQLGHLKPPWMAGPAFSPERMDRKQMELRYYSRSVVSTFLLVLLYEQFVVIFFIWEGFSLLIISYRWIQWTRRFMWFKPSERNTLCPR
jgi:hypothetical protein